MADRIQQRRDTAARWAQYNPILLEGEVGYVTDDPNQYKIGDGVHAWNELPLRGFDGTLVHTTGDSTTSVMSQKAVSDEILRLDSEIDNVLATSNIGLLYLNTNCNYNQNEGQACEEIIEHWDGRIMSDKFAITAPLNITCNKNIQIVAIRYYSDIDSTIVLEDTTGTNAGAARIILVANGTMIAVDESYLYDLIIYNNGEVIYSSIAPSEIATKKDITNNLNQAKAYTDEETIALKDILVNKVVHNVTGEIVTYDGRFQINRLFSVDSLNITISPSITLFYRYYDINGSFLGSSKTDEAAFVKVGGIIDESREITIEEVYKYTLTINGVTHRCVQGLSEEKSSDEEYVTTKQMQNFEYEESVPKATVGSYIAGYNSEIGTSKIFVLEDAQRAYINKVIRVSTNKVTISTNGIGDSEIYAIPIRCVDENDTYLGSPFTSELQGSFQLPSGTYGFYINAVSSKNLTDELVKNVVVTINGIDYPFAGNEGNSYVNPLGQAKAYTDEEIAKLKDEGGQSSDYYNYLVGCFERIVCIGDSITAGYTGSTFAGQNVGSNDARVTARNWPAYFKRTVGSDVINLGYGSTATTHWRNSTPETESANLYCALDLANIEGTQAYFIMLGWNDTIAVGTPSDIASDYNNNGQSFYGNYDNIVRRLHEMKPKAHIFVFTLARNKKTSSYNAAIKYIAELYPSYCHCIDYSNNEFFDTEFFSKVADSTHYSPLGYNAFGNFVRNLVSKYIYDNPDLFKGIPYTSDNSIKGNIDVHGIYLSSTNLSINEVGDYETLFAELIPNTAANKTVSWGIISGDSTCIQLIPNQSTMYCTIKGLKAGFAVVRATSSEGGYTATCLISVASEVVNVSSISLDKTNVQMTTSSSEETVNATIQPSNATNKNILWSLESGNDNVATIEGTGTACSITPRGAGSDVLIARTEDGNKEARCQISITE